MSGRVVVCRLRNLRPHPTSPGLDVAEAAGRQVVVGKHYAEGQLGLFIPEGCVVPDRLLEEMWLKGRLAGRRKNRVKARGRDGVLSEGLFYGSRWHDERGVEHRGLSWDPAWSEGQDVTEELGVT